MKKGGGGGGGDTVLESRHLMGLFLGVVVLCGVFFTLGYVMGRTQYDSSVRAAAIARSPASPGGVAATAPGEKTAPLVSQAPPDWSFYKAGEPKKSEDVLLSPGARQPVADAAESSPSRHAATESAARVSTTSRTNPAVVTSPAKGPASAALPSSRALLKAPRIPRGAIVLQVAALTREGDALALAGALQQKEFPAFVATPDTGNLYRVQVGPYADAQSAAGAKRSLEREGFKAIVKR